MTVYDWENNALGPAEIRDADGVEYRRVLRVDSESGEIHRVKLDDAGQILVDLETNRIETIKEIVPAPVIVEFIAVTESEEPQKFRCGTCGNIGRNFAQCGCCGDRRQTPIIETKRDSLQ